MGQQLQIRPGRSVTSHRHRCSEFLAALCNSVPGRPAGHLSGMRIVFAQPPPLPGPLALPRRGLAPRRPRQESGTDAGILSRPRRRRKGFTGQPRRAPAASSAARDCCIRRTLQKSPGAGPPRRREGTTAASARSDEAVASAAATSCLLSLTAAALSKRPSPRLHDRARRSNSQCFRRRAAAPAQEQSRLSSHRRGRSSCRGAVIRRPERPRRVTAFGQLEPPAQHIEPWLLRRQRTRTVRAGQTMKAIAAAGRDMRLESAAPGTAGARIHRKPLIADQGSALGRAGVRTLLHRSRAAVTDQRCCSSKGAVGVSSNSVRTGSSFRGRAGLPKVSYRAVAAGEPAGLASGENQGSSGRHMTSASSLG